MLHATCTLLETTCYVMLLLNAYHNLVVGLQKGSIPKSIIKILILILFRLKKYFDSLRLHYIFNDTFQ